MPGALHFLTHKVPTDPFTSLGPGLPGCRKRLTGRFLPVVFTQILRSDPELLSSKLILEFSE